MQRIENVLKKLDEEVEKLLMSHRECSYKYPIVEERVFPSETLRTD